MEAFLRSVQSQLTEDLYQTQLHAVLGGPQPDVDTVAATLALALHLSQKQQSGLVVPVLWLYRGEVPLPHDTRSFLDTLGLSEDLLFWRNQLDLASLQDQGGLSITLLREGLLHSAEHYALKSCVQRVVHRRGQREEDAGSSAVTTVAREILQEATEHVGAALGQTLGEALRLQREALWLQHGQRSEEIDELLRLLEQISYSKPEKLPDWEQLLTKDPKEFSDGETTIVLTSVTTETEEGPDLAERLKSFCHRHGYDGVVLLLSISDAACHSPQQVAVYADNADVLNQLCCELEESSSWSLSGELDAKKNLQVYHIPVNTIFPGTPPVLEQEVQALLQDFVDARSSILACHRSSRTSSTEGVAGSIDFSQSSSGITDMDGGDMERGEAESGEGPGNSALGSGAEAEDDPGAGVVELVSPDSGLTTIRSSRSSKESSVFLSDESPMGDLLTGAAPSGPGQFLRNPSPLGLLSLSPPVPPERRRNRTNRNKTENVDLFSFDPLHSTIPNTDADQAGRPSSSEMEELSLVDFSAPTSGSGLDSRNSSIDFQIQTVVPPTPVNSLVGSRPPSSCGVRFFPEDVIERINGLQHKDSVSSSLSETWDEFSFDMQGALSSSDNSSWNVAKTCESPQNVLEVIKNNESNNDAKEEVSKSDNSKEKCLEPQLSFIIEQTVSHDNWNPDSVINDKWNPVTLADLQLTPPEEEAVVKRKIGIIAPKDKKAKKKESLQTLTPDTSKEEEDENKKTGKNQMELLDFWTFSAQKGFLKLDSGTTTSYPESLDMWNMTIRDDSLNTPDCLSENSGGSLCGVSNNASMESPLDVDQGMAMWNTTIREDSSSTLASSEGKDVSQVASLETTPVTAESQNLNAENVQNNEVNVKIVIENADQENSEDVDQTESANDDANQVSDPWELEVPSMVTSTSEYDNIGGGATWSLSSSPDSSLVVDLIQLEAQSSPFVGVTQTKGEETTQQSDQVFTYEGLKDTDNRNKVKKDSETSEQSGGHSPFMLVEVNQHLEQSVSANLCNWDELSSKTQLTKTAKEELNQGLGVEIENLLSKTVSSGSVGEREGFKMSPESLHPGSRDELRSSDGDSSSGLEMESIIVSGTVKEAERVRPVVKEVKKSMETFSMLSYAATILQAQAAKHRKEEACSSQKVSIPKIVSPSQSESFNKLELSQDDEKQAALPRSSSPSLRYPSDHFLKTREEVYVHSQISMEDSDEGGQSPLGNVQVWCENLERKDTQGRPHTPTEGTPTQETPQTPTEGSSELASPVVTDSSVSRSSSYTDSSLSETAPPAESDRGLALPFSGDLMEEDEETEEETKEHSAEQPTGPTQVLRLQDVPFQPPLQLQADEAFQWAESDSGPPVQTQYGYNYHHIDQRTEHPSSPKNSSRERGGEREGEVYAEFTSVSRSEGHFEPRVIPRGSVAHSSGHYPGQSVFEGDPEDRQLPEDQHHPEQHTGSGDHARYVSDGYVHFLLSRQSQQGESADMGSREEPEEVDNREDPASSADVSAGSGHRRKLPAPPLNISLDQSEGSLLSDTGDETGDETGDDLDLNMDDMDTPDEADSVDFDAQHECEEAAAAPAPSAPGQSRESRLWRSVLIGEQEHRIDMKSIEPYKRVISHGGYYEEQHAIIVFAACFLPDSDCDNYNYVMENLFLYVISTLELMVAEDYMIVYLNGATPRRRTPGFSWMKKCYHMIDRRLKKNLKMFIIVHPSFFIRTLLGITRPFISSKFSSKIRYVHSLHELGQIIPMEYVHIPPSIIRLDAELQDTTCKSDRKWSSAV